MEKIVVQIIPNTFTSSCGVSHFAHKLALSLKQHHDVNSYFLVTKKEADNKQKMCGAQHRILRVNSSDALISELTKIKAEIGIGKTLNLMLQYSGYGYALTGAPFWLSAGLRIFLKLQPDTRFATYFHELYAWSFPWRSAFWHNRAQKQIVKSLAEMSDLIWISNEYYRIRLAKLARLKNKTVITMPVFSNIGELANNPKHNLRQNSLIIFGTPVSRRKIYDKFHHFIQPLLSKLHIEEIHDIGGAIGSQKLTPRGLNVVSHGYLDAADISRLMQSARFGISGAPNPLAKSGVFASYCAHGVIPLCNYYEFDELDGLLPGKQLYDIKQQISNFESINYTSMSDAAFLWYQTHSLKHHAQQCCIAFRF